jgi:hypothetical protein
MKAPNDGWPLDSHQEPSQKTTNSTAAALPLSVDSSTNQGSSVTPAPSADSSGSELSRSAQMPATRKLVAYTLATYANANGTNAHPGVARLAADCGIQPRAVKRYVSALRDAGLIFRTFAAPTKGRKGMADSGDATPFDRGSNS